MLAPPSSLKDQLMVRIAAESASALHPDHSAMVVVRAGESPWHPGPLPGVSVRLLNKKKTMLVRMEPGALLPMHHHPESEQCLVLEGSVTSGGVTVGAGDYVYMPAGSTHDDLRSGDSGCTFLIAYS